MPKTKKTENNLGKNVISVKLNKITLNTPEEGTIKFSKPLTITDSTEQWNGTRYDMETMDISAYKGMLTANHSMNIQSIVGKVFGIVKNKAKITIEGIKFAIKENELARFTYEMMLAGFITDFSIETVGPWPDEEGVYKNSQLVGLSVVVTGNNRSASINEIALNSIRKSQEDGLDTSTLEKELGLDKIDTVVNNEDNMLKAVKNTRSFPVSISFKNSLNEEVTMQLNAGVSIDLDEAQVSAVENQINSAPQPVDNSVIVDAVNAAVKPLMDKISELEKTAFNTAVKEPAFKKDENGKVINTMSYKEVAGKQIQAAWNALKNNDLDAMKELKELNELNVERLKEDKIVANSVTIADFGNFVISPELLSEIQGYRSNFKALLDAFTFKDTLSLSMAWLSRSGDIDMSSVEMCDDGANGNLKPISEYEATIRTSNLEELAAVTPVCNAATRFLAVDLLSDVTAGYRNDFDRKKAQLIIARLQQAVDTNGNVVAYATTSDLNSMKSWINVLAEVSETVPNGVFIMSEASRLEMLKTAIGSGVSGDVLGLLNTGDMSPILGKKAIIVPDELLPKLNTAQSKTFVVDGANVNILHAVFYVDPSNFTGRTSGGLQFDLSTEAAYEQNSVVKSAYQRNELVLRGSFFRGGAVLNIQEVAALSNEGVS